MDRIFVYPGQQITDSVTLQMQRNGMVALGKLAAAVLPQVLTGSAQANGLVCSPAANLTVQIGMGELYSVAPMDGTPYGSLPADTSDMIVKQAIQLQPVTLSGFAAPASAGQSINYLIEAAYADADTGSTVLQYYNAANPTVPLVGQGGGGAAQPTVRTGVINYTVKAGAPAASGSQVTPTPDAGTVGLWVVTVANGQSSITAANIAPYPAAPFIVGSWQPWGASVPYPAGAFVVQGGYTWMSLAANFGQPPSTSPSYWQRWGLSLADLAAASLPTQSSATAGLGLFSNGSKGVWSPVFLPATHTQSSTNLLLQSQNFGAAPWSASSAFVQPTTNQLLQSQNFGAAPWTATGVSAAPATNLLPASGAFNMWTAFNGAVGTPGASDPFGGANAWTITGSTSGAGIVMTSPVFSNANHTASVYMKQGTSTISQVTIYNQAETTAYSILNVSWSGGVPSTLSTAGSVNSITYTSVGSGWYRISFWMTMPAVGSAAFILYPDANNTSKTTLVYGPQFEYGATLNAYNASPGNANLLPNSNNFAAWQLSSPPPAFGGGYTDPNGTATAMSIAGSLTGAAYLYETVTLPFVGANVSVSVYLRQGSAQTNTLAVCQGLSTSLGSVNVTWSSGVPTTAAVGGAQGVGAVNVGNGWYRVSFYVNAGSNTSVNIVFYPDNSNSAKTTEFYCAQAELGSAVNAYNPTSGAINYDPMSAAGAYILSQTSANTFHYFTQSVNKYGLAQAWTFSICLRAGTLTQAAINLVDGTGANYAGFGAINLSTGTLGSPQSGGSGFVITASSVAAITGASGWFRYSFSVLTNTGTTLAVQIFPGVGGQFAGNPNANILAYGAQLELGATATAYNGTTTVNNVVAAPDGTNTAMRLVAAQSTGFHFISQMVSASFTAGQYATFSVYAQPAQFNQLAFQLSGVAFPNAPATLFTLSGAGTCVSSSQTALPNAQITSLPGGWYRCVITAPVGGTGTGMIQLVNQAGGVTFIAGDGVSGINIWGAQWEVGQIAGPYVATTTTAASGGGFLVTNLLLNSGQMQTWGTYQLTTVANAMPAPDGSFTATQLSETINAGIHTVNQTVGLGVSPTATYTFSCWAKAGARSSIQLLLEGLPSTFYAGCIFNLATGVAGTPNAVGATAGPATMQYAGNGWYRCSISVTNLPASDNQLLGTVFLVLGTTTGYYQGDGVSGCYVWGGQLEQNGQYVGPGCYVPTTTVAASGASFQMATRQAYILNSANGPYTLALPSCPNPDDFVELIDTGLSAIANNITIARNGSLIEGQASDLVINCNFGGLKMTYTIDKGWVVR